MPPSDQLRTEVRNGLLREGQKELAARFFYDDLGSALFDAITLLPEYGLSRADARLLRAHAAEIAARAPAGLVAELGSGSGVKTRALLEAMTGPVRYFPIDVSKGALDLCAAQLGGLATVEPVVASYLDGMARVGAIRKNELLFAFFLGSSIGNFSAEGAREFLAALRARMRAGDVFLLGADLVKPVDRLLAAYDDPTGVTAAFNLNILGRINRELGSNFDQRAFRHMAIYDHGNQRVEMHLESLRDQMVAIPGADCVARFEAGETIWTESSHKYRPEQLNEMAAEAGFGVEAMWIDEEWPFAECLWTVR